MARALPSLLKITWERRGGSAAEFGYGIPECEDACVDWQAGDGALISSHETAVNSFSSPDGAACPCRGNESPFTIVIDTGEERVDMSAVCLSASGNI